MNCNSGKFDAKFLDLTDLFRSTDVSEDFNRNISLSEYDIENEFDEPININGTVKNSLGIITFKAVVKGTHNAVCARCAEPVKIELESRLDTILTQTEAKDDSVTIENGKIDLAKTAYDALSLEIPLVVICDEDCKGLCPQCGTNLNNGNCNCVQ
ncbi:MAG: hypothetical protein DBX47_00350 [Clostridiales bacterium]|nr:MAG: hypothetical protein DBX47_00350 [Clostridiales bacterium]